MKSIIWDETYTVNSFLVNPQKRLGLFGLLNLLQDTAWVHATHLGHGYEKMLEADTAWVLTRQNLQMSKWPTWGDEVTIKTWIRPIKSMIAFRDFEIWSKGEKYGECSTQWLILDLKTRRASEKSHSIFEGQWREDLPEFIDTKKIHVSALPLSHTTEFLVRNSDLDLNGHVNNTKYAQWILDSISLQTHQDYSLEAYEVNFLNEVRSSDSILIKRVPLSDDVFQFQGVRAEDRKIAFIANLKVSAGQLAP